MIVVFGSFPIIFLAFIILAVLGVGHQAGLTIIKALPYLFCAFIAKDLFIDVGISGIKNRRNLLCVVFSLLFDILRTILFFYMVHQEALDFSGLGGIIDFWLLIIIGGIIFLAGEFLSLGHTFQEQDWSNAFSICGDFSALMLLAGIYALFYLS